MFCCVEVTRFNQLMLTQCRWVLCSDCYLLPFRFLTTVSDNWHLQMYVRSYSVYHGSDSIHRSQFEIRNTLHQYQAFHLPVVDHVISVLEKNHESSKWQNFCIRKKEKLLKLRKKQDVTYSKKVYLNNL